MHRHVGHKARLLERVGRLAIEIAAQAPTKVRLTRSGHGVGLGDLVLDPRGIPFLFLGRDLVEREIVVLIDCTIPLAFVRDAFDLARAAPKGRHALVNRAHARREQRAAVSLEPAFTEDKRRKVSLDLKTLTRLGRARKGFRSLRIHKPDEIALREIELGGLVGGTELGEDTRFGSGDGAMRPAGIRIALVLDGRHHAARAQVEARGEALRGRRGGSVVGVVGRIPAVHRGCEGRRPVRDGALVGCLRDRGHAERKAGHECRSSRVAESGAGGAVHKNTGL